MKAYWATEVDGDWGFFVHGETRGKAKYRALFREPSGFWLWNSIRLTRRPALDDTPFTTENVSPSGGRET